MKNAELSRMQLFKEFKLRHPEATQKQLKNQGQSKIKNFKFWITVFTFYIPLLFLLSGCNQKSDFKKAQGYVRLSQFYYEEAIAQYKKLIAKGDDLNRLYFRLGQLYYNHGEFQNAIGAFQKSGDITAKKFLAISYYRLGNFTDALEIFNKIELSDDEYLYYHGLTCEKLNLFDQALNTYKKIKEKQFALLAEQRANIIERQVDLGHIKEINPEVNKILMAAPSLEQYPQAGALILQCDEKIEITPQDTQVAYLHYIIKILNERGKKNFSEIQIDYDSTYEKVELEYARTLRPDGRTVEVGSRHIRDVSKYLNFPLYSNVRVYIISFPEITEGASIEYKLKLYRNQLINKKNIVLRYPVQASEPIIAANFTVSTPKDKPLNIKIINEKYNNFGARLEPDIKENDGYLVYRWQFKDIPQIIPESNMPPEIEINSAMLISTFGSWQEVYDWWWNLAKDKIRADSAIKQKVHQLTHNQDSQEAKIRAIYNFCAQKIRYVAVEYGQAGYEPHYACDIFKYKYGDCKDQAILLVAMLKEAGIQAYPVLISTRDNYNLSEDFPSVLFDHCIAAVSLKDKIVFLDPTAETCPFGDLPTDDQDRKVFILKEDGYDIQSTPLYPAEHNLIKQYINIKINADETVTAQKSNFTYGVYDRAQRFWLLYTAPELVEDALKEKIQESVIGAKLEGYSIKNLDNLNEPIVLSYNFKGAEYFTNAGTLRIAPWLAALDTSLVAKDKRKYAIDFGKLDTKETIFEIELPSSFAVKYIPGSVSEDSPWLRFSAEYNFKNNKVYFIQKIQLKKKIISENEYQDFKKFFEGLARKIKQRMVLEKIK